jgi:hypothetical protein
VIANLARIEATETGEPLSITEQIELVKFMNAFAEHARQTIALAEEAEASDEE